MRKLFVLHAKASQSFIKKRFRFVSRKKNTCGTFSEQVKQSKS